MGGSIEITVERKSTLRNSPKHKDSAMAHDVSNHIPQDRTQIDVTESGSVEYWTDTLGVSEQALRMAVAEAGVSTAAVSDHLGHAPL